jgi:glycosyltransferase involved in cell wall biosynthesis
MLSVIIPVYNEERFLGQLVTRVFAVPCEKQVILVDDCSTDATPQIIAQLQQKFGDGLLTLRHEKNRGKGAAIRTGLAAVQGDIVIIQDADLEYHPEDYPPALHLIQNGWADAVYGSRFMGPHRVFLYWHYAANKFLTWLVNVAANTILSDMETGFKMFRTEVLKSLDIHSFKFDFEVEVTIKLFRLRYRVYEMPITYTGRGYEEGKKITWKDGVHALYAIAKWSLLYHPKPAPPKRAV